MDLLTKAITGKKRKRDYNAYLDNLKERYAKDEDEISMKMMESMVNNKKSKKGKKDKKDKGKKNDMPYNRILWKEIPRPWKLFEKKFSRIRSV